MRLDMLIHSHERLLSMRPAEEGPRSAIFQKTRDDACRLALYGPMKRQALGLAACWPGSDRALRVEGKNRCGRSHERHSQSWTATAFEDALL